MDETVTPNAEPSPQAAQKTPPISAEERARRKEAVDYARGSVRLEGFILSDFAEDLNRRFIDGEITQEQKTAALLEHYKV